MRKRPKILIVDDEEIVRESLRDWLDSVGYKVEIAASGGWSYPFSWVPRGKQSGQEADRFFVFFL